ncbi:MAG: prepilin-type N-terminal cleavage/methylation domain-containing protein, partial [Actinomycetota bacterium]
MTTRRHEDERGFTLIELMVVVLIIAILIAIAIPTFLGARERAQDRAAQSSLRNGLTAAKTIFTDNEDYTDATRWEVMEPAVKVSVLDEGARWKLVDAAGKS